LYKQGEVWKVAALAKDEHSSNFE